ncbi:hypothetical protein [Spirosoma jeollabukense]
MKYPFLLLFFCSFTALAQVKLPTNETGQVQYQELVKLPDNTRKAKQIIEQAKAWAGHEYDSLSAEQQYDQVNNILFIKSLYLIDSHNVRYTLTIEAKYGRYRATITDLLTESNGLSLLVRPTSPTVDEMMQAAGNKITAKEKEVIEQTVQQQTELYQQINKSCRATLASLKTALTAAPKEE